MAAVAVTPIVCDAVDATVVCEIYRLSIACRDDAGNTAMRDVTVTVPHDRGR